VSTLDDMHTWVEAMAMTAERDSAPFALVD